MNKYENMIIAKFNREEDLQKKDEEENESEQERGDLIESKIKIEMNIIAIEYSRIA